VTPLKTPLIFLVLCMPILTVQGLPASRNAIFMHSLRKRHLKEAIDAHVLLWDTLKKYLLSPDQDTETCIHELIALKNTENAQDLQKAYSHLKSCNKALKRLLKGHKKLLKAQKQGLFAYFKHMIKEAAILIERGKSSLDAVHISDLSL
jgi:hypothetical protein